MTWIIVVVFYFWGGLAQAFTPESLQCEQTMTSEPSGLAIRGQNRLSNQIKLNQMALIERHLIEQNYWLSQMGIASPMIAPELEREITEAKKRCQGRGKNPWQAAVLSQLISAVNHARSLNPENSLALKKRYLLASLEVQRLRLRLADSAPTPEQKGKWLDHLRQLQLHYPLAGATVIDVDQVSLHRPELMYVTRSESTHPQLMSYLIPNHDGGFLPHLNQQPRLTSAGILAMDISNRDELPAAAEAALATAMTMSFRPYLRSIGELCQLDPCTTMELNHSYLASELEQGDQLEATRQALCHCEISSRQSLVGETPMLVAGAATLASIGGCLFTGWLCPVAAAVGAGTAGLSVVNSLQAIAQVHEFSQLKRMQALVPSMDNAELERIQTREQESLTTLVQSSAMSVLSLAGVRVAMHGAGQAAPAIYRIGQQLWQKLPEATYLKFESLGFTRAHADAAAALKCMPGGG